MNMRHEDPLTYKRATNGALLGLLVQGLFTAVFGAIALALSSPAMTAATWYAAGGLGLWLMLAVVYSQHRLERLEALENEQLAQRHGAGSSLFETSAEDLSLVRRRVRRLHRWGLPIVSLLTAGYLVGLGLYLLMSGRTLLVLLNASRTTLLPGDPRLETLARLFGQSASLKQLPAMLGMTTDKAMLYLTVLAVTALVGFVTSRYLAGMASLRQWQLLRGGAGYLMGNVLVAATAALAFGLVHADRPGLLKYLIVAIPVVMLVIGAEMLLNFVLEIYRPRKPGEVPRPAFDSRLLSLLTTPESIAKTINEAINYQFGFEITRSWFWQLLSRAFGYLVLMGAAVLLGLSSLVVVGPHEQAVVRRFGRLVNDRPLGPGLHVKWPWPVEQARVYDVKRLRSVAVGSRSALKADTPILWTNQHTEATPENLIVAPPAMEQATGASPGAGRQEPSAGPSVSLVNAEIDVDYHIGDLLAYLRSAQRVDRCLENLATAEVSRYLYTRDIDAWLGPWRLKAGEELAGRIQRAADAAGLGLVIDGVRIKSIHPPQQQEVAAAFHEVVAAEQEKIEKIEQARKQAIEVLAGVAGSVEQAQRIKQLIEELDRMKDAGAAETAIAAKTAELEAELFEAGGQAARTLAEARAYRWQRENVERAAATRFEKELLGFRSAPQLYAMRRYLEVLTDGLKDARKYLLLADRDRLVLRFDFKELAGAAVNVPLGELEEKPR